MNILDMINGNNGAAVQQLAAQFGLPPDQAEAALSALLPLVTAGLQREVATNEGEAGLAAALARGSHEKFIAQPEVLASSGNDCGWQCNSRSHFREQGRQPSGRCRGRAENRHRSGNP